VLLQARMVPTIPIMAPKKNRTGDRHKPRRMTGIRAVFIAPVDAASKAIGTDFTEWVNQAVREKLERDGHWPPR